MVDGWKLKEKPNEMKIRSLVAQVCDSSHLRV